jgi:hypothetical protein
MRIIPAIACIALLSAASIADATAASFYGGAAVGQAFDGRYSGLPGRLDTDNTAKLSVGWQLVDGWSVEGAWHDLGNASVAPIADFGSDTSTDGYSIGVRYVAQVDFTVQPFAKVGYFLFNEDGETITIAGPRRFDEDDRGLMAEVGGLWKVNNTFGVRAGYEWFDFDNGSDGAFNLGAEIHF